MYCAVQGRAGEHECQAWIGDVGGEFYANPSDYRMNNEFVGQSTPAIYIQGNLVVENPSSYEQFVDEITRNLQSPIGGNV